MSKCTKENCPMQVGTVEDCDLKDCPYRTEKTTMQQEMAIELKPCPFCGGRAIIYGHKIKDYVDGVLCDYDRSVYWVQTFCLPRCVFGNLRAVAYGVIGGIEYNTPEAAAEAWNRRADDGKEVH